MAHNFDERKCAYCGKMFIPAAYHQYKYCGKLLCSYPCELRYKEQRAQERAQERENRRKAGKLPPTEQNATEGKFEPLP